ncbi:aminopeptidase [Candidatus Woesearchaeota archaeon]|nr:aminopeptidase [Candidatus Woesearchaeota archaeon]
MEKAAETIVKDCMRINENESVLVITDSEKRLIGDAIFEAAKKITSKASYTEIPVGKYNGEEPPENVAADMCNFDVVLMATAKSLSHTKARKNACEKGARIASMPNITEDMMKRTLSADYFNITEVTEKINSQLEGNKIRIVTEAGTDITMEMDKRHKFTDQGLYHEKGDWGNLPAGEAGMAPVEGKTEGVFVVDASMAGIGKLKEPIKVIVKQGFVVDIQGGEEALELKKMLENFNDSKVFNIAELGIGTNDKAQITGNVLEDEKVLGTAHIAFGNNTAYGGRCDAPCHLDGVFKNPTIYVDDKKIMENGKLLI